MVLIATLTMVIWSALRVVLWIDVGPGNAGWANALTVFVLGLGFDLATLALVIAPLLLLVALVPNVVRRTRWYMAFRWAYVWLACAVVLLVAVAEFLFWREFTTRFNFIAVDYLVCTARSDRQHPRIVCGRCDHRSRSPRRRWRMTLALQRKWRFATAPLGAARRLALIAAAILLPLASICLVNIDQMAGTGNAFVDELSATDLMRSSRRTAATSSTTTDSTGRCRRPRPTRCCKRWASPQDPSAAATHRPPMPHEPARRSDPFMRNAPERRADQRSKACPPNSSACIGRRERPDAQPRRAGRATSLLFDHFFATGTRTVRGLEALSAGDSADAGPVDRRAGPATST